MSASIESVSMAAKNPATPAAVGIILACVIGIVMLGLYGCWVRKKVFDIEHGTDRSDRKWSWKDFFVNPVVQPDAEACGLPLAATLGSRCTSEADAAATWAQDSTIASNFPHAIGALGLQKACRIPTGSHRKSFSLQIASPSEQTSHATASKHLCESKVVQP